MLLAGAIAGQVTGCTLLFDNPTSSASDAGVDGVSDAGLDAESPLPEPAIAYFFGDYPEFFDGVIDNEGSFGEDPKFELFDGDIEGGGLVCPGDDRCGQSFGSELLGPCLAAQEISVVLDLESASEQPQESDFRPDQQIVRITNLPELENLIVIGTDVDGGEVANRYQARVIGDDSSELFYLSNQQPAQPTTRHQLAFVLNGAEGALYIDDGPGVVATESMPRLRDNGESWRLKIGSDSGLGDWVGKVYSLRFYCVALRADEIARLHAEPDEP